MKKLTLLLTSLLLTAGANAGIAEFTTDNTQVEGWRDFQVAHPCWFSRAHVGTHDHAGAQCAKPSWILKCIKQKRPLGIHKGGECGQCPAGQVSFLEQHRPRGFSNYGNISYHTAIQTDKGALANAHRCVEPIPRSELECHTNKYGVYYCIKR